MRTVSLASFAAWFRFCASQRCTSTTLSCIVLLALLVSPCAAAKIEDHKWVRIAQARVQLITDLKPAKATALMRELSLFRSVVERYIPSKEGFEDDLQIILFARRRDFTKLYKPRHFGAFTLPQLTQTSLVVAPSGERNSLRKHLFHEYVHYRVRASIAQSAPVWFEEGLASLLADVEFAAVKGDQSSDQPDVSMLGSWPGYSGLRPFPLQRLLAARGVERFSTDEAFNFYTTSHHLVREILLAQNFDKTAIDGFVFQQEPTIEKLFDRPSSEVKRLLRRSYDRPGPALAIGSLVTSSVDDQWAVSAVPAEEVLELLGRTLLSVNPKGAQRLFDRSARSEPGNAGAWLGIAEALANQEKNEAAMVAFQRAEQLEPDAAKVAIARGLLSTRGCLVRRDADCLRAWRAAVTDLRRGLFDEPDRFDAIYRLGQAHLYLGQPGEAVNYLAIAVQRAPWSARVNYFLGEAYRLLGDSRARRHLERAERWSGSAFFRSSAEASLAQLTTNDGSQLPNSTP